MSLFVNDSQVTAGLGGGWGGVGGGAFLQIAGGFRVAKPSRNLTVQVGNSDVQGRPFGPVQGFGTVKKMTWIERDGSE